MVKNLVFIIIGIRVKKLKGFFWCEIAKFYKYKACNRLCKKL